MIFRTAAQGSVELALVLADRQIVDTGDSPRRQAVGIGNDRWKLCAGETRASKAFQCIELELLTKQGLASVRAELHFGNRALEGISGCDRYDDAKKSNLGVSVKQIARCKKSRVNGDAAQEPRKKTGRRVLAGAHFILRVHGMPPPSRSGADAVVKSLKCCVIGWRCE
jgi:hypothetical protein